MNIKLNPKNPNELALVYPPAFRSDRHYLGGVFRRHNGCGCPCGFLPGEVSKEEKMTDRKPTSREIEANLRFHICGAAERLHEELNGLGAQMYMVGRLEGEKRLNRLMQLFGSLWTISERNTILSIALDNLEEFKEEQAEERRS